VVFLQGSSRGLFRTREVDPGKLARRWSSILLFAPCLFVLRVWGFVALGQPLASSRGRGGSAAVPTPSRSCSPTTLPSPRQADNFFFFCFFFFAHRQRHAAVGCPLRHVEPSTQLLWSWDLIWPGIDKPDRLSYSALPESADEMHLLHSLSCTS
jgi:hypothetical protein